MQISHQIDSTNSQVSLNINNFTDLNNLKVSSVEKETKEKINYISIAGCVYEHIITNPDLTFAQKLLYFTVDASSIINLYYEDKRIAALSAKDWAKKISCSSSKIDALQKSLKKKKYFDVLNQKNDFGQHNPNLITPTIPNKYIQALHNTPNIRNLPDLDIDNLTKTLSHSEFKRFILDKSKFFIKLDYSLFNNIAADSSLSDFEKIIVFDFYMNSYKSFFASKGGGCSFIFTTKELMARYSCCKSYISTALKKLHKSNYINCELSKHKDSNNKRKDHYIWTFSLIYDFNKLFPKGFNNNLGINNDISLNYSENKNNPEKENENIMFSEYSEYSKLHYNIQCNIKQNIKHDFYKKPSSNKALTFSKNKPFSLDLTGFPSVHYSGYAVHYSGNYRVNKNSLNNIDSNIDIRTNENFKNSTSKYLNYLSVFYKNKNFIKNPFIDLTKKIINGQETELKPTSEEVNNQPTQERIKEQVKNNQKIKLAFSKDKSQVKARKPKELKEKKRHLIDHHPLREEQVEILQIRSKRNFDANFINQLLLKLSKNCPNHVFKTEEDFIKYMTKVLINELHESAKVNRVGFELKANIEREQTKEEQGEALETSEENREEEKQEAETDWREIKENMLKACGNTSNREEIAAMLSQIKAEEYRETKTIKLKISNNYVRKQAERNYGSYIGGYIEKYAKAAGYEKIIISS